jgi:hypothetical protein
MSTVGNHRKFRRTCAYAIGFLFHLPEYRNGEWLVLFRRIFWGYQVPSRADLVVHCLLPVSNRYKPSWISWPQAPCPHVNNG